MDMVINKKFGSVITRLINGQNLSSEESYQAFCLMLNNEVTEMQQGAFLASLTAKGETAEEVAGGWKAIYEFDTVKVDLSDSELLVDNCGTGMDTFKTFNISTGASIVAAAGGLKVARHGARAITSVCGTVDMAEALGVDVECEVGVVANSIEKVGLGLFNGMSPMVHPMALGRILSQISFGSPLNIAASLANPALPTKAVRGVYAKEMIMPVTQVMQSIGYTDAIVIYGTIENSDMAMDEASVCGVTYGAWLKNGIIEEFSFTPEECGLKTHKSDTLVADQQRELAAVRMLSLLKNRGDEARLDALLLNSALLFLVTGQAETMRGAVDISRECMDGKKPLAVLEKWVKHQNRNSQNGMDKLNTLLQKV